MVAKQTLKHCNKSLIIYHFQNKILSDSLVYIIYLEQLGKSASLSMTNRKSARAVPSLTIDSLLDNLSSLSNI